MSTAPFIDDDFLLQSPVAQQLFHETAKGLPIIDYHNHIDPVGIAENKSFDNVTQLWVSSDPYKHRAMRINGIPEAGITGERSDLEKFQNWANTLPKTLGNPLFHWSCLELKRTFGIEEYLTEHSSSSVWGKANEHLQQDAFSTNGILKRWHIESLCTSDNWLDDLSVHSKATEVSEINVWPSLRADALLGVDQKDYVTFLAQFAEKTNQTIQSLSELESALVIRLQYFDDHSCKMADHALDAGFCFDHPGKAKAAQIFKRVLAQEHVSATESRQLQSYLLAFLGKEYGKLGWIMQLHVGAQRDTSSRLRKLAGAAGGYATIGRFCDIESLCRLLDHLESDGYLPDTILYTLNPADNAAFATLTGSFSEDGNPGKIQFGPAWWYNDHLTGIQDQLQAQANYGLLSQFIGMTTDSRSILSFSRHEYFRRLLCNMIGSWVTDGMIPNDEALLSQLVSDISYNNSKKKLENGKELKR